MKFYYKVLAVIVGVPVGATVHPPVENFSHIPSCSESQVGHFFNLSSKINSFERYNIKPFPWQPLVKTRYGTSQLQHNLALLLCMVKQQNYI